MQDTAAFRLSLVPTLDTVYRPRFWHPHINISSRLPKSDPLGVRSDRLFHQVVLLVVLRVFCLVSRRSFFAFQASVRSCYPTTVC